MNVDAPNGWVPRTMAETFARIVREPAYPWLSLGDFLDDWRRVPPEALPALAQAPIQPSGPELALLRWAALCAATVEWLCRLDGLPSPPSTARDEYRLAEPWFLYPGHLLRPWQLATTPAPFKLRNIFGGDRILDRV